MIAIVNISPPSTYHDKEIEHEYEVRVNHVPQGRFFHHRREGLSACLRKAAEITQPVLPGELAATPEQARDTGKTLGAKLRALAALELTTDQAFLEEAAVLCEVAAELGNAAALAIKQRDQARERLKSFGWTDNL